MTLLTEKEAAEKWCPMARATVATGDSFVVGAPVFNRVIDIEDVIGTVGHNPFAARCIGSKCMAFRWHDEGERVEYKSQSVAKLPGETNPPFSNMPDGYELTSYNPSDFHCRKEISRQPRRGYCGAFGKVEA